MGADLLSESRIDREENDYVEELDYSPMRRSFLDRVSLPGILVAAGCLVLVVLLSFLFVRLQTSGLRSQIFSLADRIDALENRLLNVDAQPQADGPLKAQLERIDSLSARIDRMEASMPTIMDQIKRELDNRQRPRHPPRRRRSRSTTRCSRGRPYTASAACTMTVTA